jgi:hypothetical protein
MPDAVANLRCPHCGSVIEDVQRSTVDGKLYATCGCVVSAEVRQVLLFNEEPDGPLARIQSRP